MKRFSDIAKEQILDGEKIRIDDIINTEITILKYAIKESRYSKNESGDYLTIQFELNGKKQVVFTGSDVLIEQMKQYGDQLPFVSTIRKINRYYSLT